MSAFDDTRATSSEHLTIPTWANGPDGSGNGGWSASLIAQHVPEPLSGRGVAVSLRVPPPIGRALRVEVDDRTGEARLLDEDTLVASALPHSVTVEVPHAARAITLEIARGASAGFPFRDHHPFPRCICCGIAREADQPSLEIHCGAVDGVTAPDAAGADVPVYADVWEPHADVADADDLEQACVAACWSALDCPSAAPFADGAEARTAVLARIAVQLDRAARVGEPHVLVAWQRHIDGRKCFSASALLDASGSVLGRAEALWIEVRS